MMNLSAYDFVTLLRNRGAKFFRWDLLCPFSWLIVNWLLWIFLSAGGWVLLLHFSLVSPFCFVFLRLCFPSFYVKLPLSAAVWRPWEEICRVSGVGGHPSPVLLFNCLSNLLTPKSMAARGIPRKRERLYIIERERERVSVQKVSIHIYLSIFPACHVDLRCTRTIQIRSEKTFPPPTRKSSFFFFSVCLFVMKRRECVRCDVVPALLPPPNDVTSKQKKK